MLMNGLYRRLPVLPYYFYVHRKCNEMQAFDAVNQEFLTDRRYIIKSLGELLISICVDDVSNL